MGVFARQVSKLRQAFQFPLHGDRNIRSQWLAGVLQSVLLLLAALALIDSIYYFWPFETAEGRFHTLFVAGNALCLGLFLFLNHNPSFSRVVRPLTILLLAISILFSDDPANVVWGASFVLFALPVISASFLIFPSASFIAALFVTVELEIFAAITVPGRETFPIYNAISLLAIGGVAWLIAASMERVLAHLEALVAERTMRLNQTVIRLTEATATISAYSEKLELTSTRLEQANQFRNLFLTSFRDELETPLKAILQSSAPDQPESQVVEHAIRLTRIQRNGRFLQAVINYIFDLGDLELDKLKLHCEAIDLLPLVNDVVNLLGEQLEIRKQRIALDLPAEPIQAFIDRRRIEQVLANLLSAASKFSPLRSEIAISLQKMPDDQTVRLTLRDGSSGVNPDSVSRMFQPERRLGVSRRIIEKHDGKLWAENPSGGGTLFILELPTRDRITQPSIRIR